METAAVHQPGDLSVDRIQTEFLISGLFFFILSLSRQWELQSFQQSRMIVIKICDRIHWHGTLQMTQIWSKHVDGEKKHSFV